MPPAFYFLIVLGWGENCVIPLPSPLSSLPFPTPFLHPTFLPSLPPTHLLISNIGTSLVVQWVTLRAPNAGGPGSIPGQGTRSHMHAATKSAHATAKKSACRN